MTRVSIKTVAAAAGVSFQTASKVLNGKGSVSPGTRERIVGAADRLGYVPNGAARALVTRSTRTVGIVAADLADSVLALFVAGAEREARARGLCVFIGTLDPDGADGERFLRLLIERRVDGLLLAAPQLERAAYVAPVVHGRLPAVSIYAVVGDEVPWVGNDQFHVGELATGHLLAAGRRRVATITGHLARRAARDRLLGWEQAHRTVGRVADPALVEHADWLIDGGRAAAERLLDRAPDVDGVVVQNDMMAIGALEALRERGRRVPDDCAVIGCDDIPVAAHTLPPLATVHVPFHEVGATAMRHLLEIIDDRSRAARRIVVPVRLVCRATCGCTPTATAARDAAASGA
jgi:LacI family transcriptional regulator